jgi:hypothetical protein
MQVNQTTDPEDVYWLYKNMTRLCGVLGTDLKKSMDDKGRPIFEVQLGGIGTRREE